MTESDTAGIITLEKFSGVRSHRRAVMPRVGPLRERYMDQNHDKSSVTRTRPIVRIVKDLALRAVSTGYDSCRTVVVLSAVA